jgi:hypothetical protein
MHDNIAANTAKVSKCERGVMVRCGFVIGLQPLKHKKTSSVVDHRVTEYHTYVVLKNDTDSTILYFW